jgi:ketosteroid isomerase-like protein
MATDITHLEQKWAVAELKADVAFLDSLLTDDFVAIGPRGFILNKSQWLERHTAGSLKCQTFVWEDVVIREHGNAAVVTGHQTQQATYEGNDASADLRIMQVLVQEDGEWRVAGIQMSPVMGPPQSGERAMPSR